MARVATLKVVVKDPVVHSQRMYLNLDDDQFFERTINIYARQKKVSPGADV